MTTRVYVAGTVSLLRQWWQAGEIAPGTARFVAPDEDEESEYAALEAAAEASTDLAPASGRRVVVVAVAADPDAGIPLTDVAAVHADTGDAGDGGGLGWFATQEVAGLLGEWSV